MPEYEDWIDRFVAHLESMRDSKDRGALAALRRGLGSPLGAVASMYPYILPWAPASRRAEDACYLVAALFALHPQAGGEGNLGKTFSKVSNPNESMEKRFVALLNCSDEDLPDLLRHAVSFLKSKDIPIDWQQLLKDVLGWNHESRFVQQQWARGFWQSSPQKTEPEEEMVQSP